MTEAAKTVQNVTGLNIVARSLKLAPGDEVLATDHEYGARDRSGRHIGLLTSTLD